jgi:pimeloyl-ACP methyl ester carboxylesterase
MRRRWFRWLRALLIAGIAYVALGFWAQDTARRVLFIDLSPSYWIAGDFVGLPTEDGVRIAALDLPNPAARFTVLYLHGNASELGRDRPFLEEMRAHGWAVLAIDYHGYGCSGGSPSERALYVDARAALQYLRVVRHVPPERVIVYGYSLGGGPAVELATHERVAGLVLQSAFTSAFAVETDWGAALFAPFDLFRNRAKIAQIGCPLLIFHGRFDRVVPFEHAERLYARAREPKQVVAVKAAGHNDLRQVMGECYWEALADFARSLKHPAAVESR